MIIDEKQTKLVGSKLMSAFDVYDELSLSALLGILQHSMGYELVTNVYLKSEITFYLSNDFGEEIFPNDGKFDTIVDEGKYLFREMMRSEEYLR